jgi:RNA polymerase sigma-70 factor (ECF subfamily)
MQDKNLYARFEALFREHYNDLSNYACSIIRSKQDAEDVVQEIFIRLWQNSPSQLENPQIKFYLLTAVKNGCISLLRKEAHKKLIDLEVVYNLQSPEEKPTPRNHAADFIDQALALLPPQCQVIFKMSRMGKLTYQQIAEELGLSVKTVENQMGKALKIMRDFARQHQISFSLLVFMLWVK